jgi:hypothetical protein
MMNSIHLDRDVVDLQGANRGQTVLDGLDADVALFDARAAAPLGNARSGRGDPHGAGDVGPHENDTGIFHTRAKDHRDLLASEQASAGELGLILYRFLQLQVCLPSPSGA